MKYEKLKCIPSCYVDEKACVSLNDAGEHTLCDVQCSFGVSDVSIHVPLSSAEQKDKWLSLLKR